MTDTKVKAKVKATPKTKTVEPPFEMQPTFDRVIVRPDEVKAETASGIIISSRAREKPMKGTVVAAGPGKFLENGDRVDVTVKPGDYIIYPTTSGIEIEVGGSVYLVMYESEIVGVFKTNPN